MKKFLNKKINFLVIFLLAIFTLSLMSPFLIFADDTVCPPGFNYCPLEGKAFSQFNNGQPTTDLTSFLAAAVQFGLAIAAALAVIMIVWGGVEIMLSESVFKKDDGKKKIQDAIWGLLLALVSWLILFTINPDILKFKI